LIAFRGGLSSHHEIVDPDRKPSQANAGRVPDCVRDRASRAGDADFTEGGARWPYVLVSDDRF
jgi:hypothetical protein